MRIIALGRNLQPIRHARHDSFALNSRHRVLDGESIDYGDYE